MMPSLAGGDYVIASRYFRRLKKGDLVIVDHPHYKRIVKRIHTMSENHKLLLSGENAQSISCEKMGWVSTSTVYGKVIFSIKK